MKLFWKIYYKFNKPKTKSEIVKSYCRMNGAKYKDLALSAFTSPTDFNGVPMMEEK